MEEIIIDGVNVAGCDAYKDKHCKDKTSIIFCDTNLCSNYPYCYYKQLKRLEQENADLKKYIERMDEPELQVINAEIALENAKLKAENDRLKEEIETRDNLIDHFRDEALYRATIASEYQKDKTKLEQTLQEIKAIATRAFAVCDDDCGNANRFTEILDLITKTEEE